MAKTTSDSIFGVILKES